LTGNKMPRPVGLGNAPANRTQNKIIAAKAIHEQLFVAAEADIW
jgi:hypothetical protein